MKSRTHRLRHRSMLAIAVIRYLLENGYHIPQDVAVTGYDNISISSMVFPSLSTMAQPIHEMGTAAADILFKKIENNSYNKSLLLQSNLSAGIPPENSNIKAKHSNIL